MNKVLYLLELGATFTQPVQSGIVAPLFCRSVQRYQEKKWGVIVVPPLR